MVRGSPKSRAHDTLHLTPYTLNPEPHTLYPVAFPLYYEPSENTLCCWGKRARHTAARYYDLGSNVEGLVLWD